MADQEYAEHLGRAWALHRQGQNDNAIQEFSGLLQLSPNNIDALYGLALSQRSAGRLEEAKNNFERCLVEVESALTDHPGEDRYEMLKRFVMQRIAEMKGETTTEQ